MLESERRSTVTASQLSIEEVYIDSDATLVNEGYQFDFPYQFNADESQNKLIGIRRLSLVPGSYAFDIDLRVYIVDKDSAEYDLYDSDVSGNVSIYYHINATSQNSVEEILYDLSEKFKLTGTLNDDSGEKHNYTARLVYHYDQRTGELIFYVLQRFEKDADGSHYSDKELLVNFEFGFRTNDVDDDQLLKFLNNRPTDPLRNLLSDKNNKKRFTNVWNRSSLNFHSTFSSSHRNYIGRAGDSWNIPSKLYKYPYGCGNFTIWTTTDGVNKLVIIDSELTVELCYVLNYKNNLNL